MSSSSLCQGLQSCLEPRVIEPRVLRLKLTPPSTTTTTTNNKASSSSTSVQENPLTNHECDDKKDTNTVENMDERGWSFLQALTKPTSSNCNKEEDDKVYVHPTVKRSSSLLSEKSLEMCTESLGSETGSNAGESCDDISLFSLENNITTTTTTTTTTNGTDSNWVSRRVNKACNFPPPLTSITDFGGVRVRPHREGGRLILEAVASPSPRPCFHAERGDGRLRLHLFEEEGLSDDGDDDEVVDEEEEVVEEWSDDDDINDDESDDEVEEESETEIETEKEEEEEEECGVENVEDEMGVKKFNRPSRCKESGNRDIFGDGYFELPSLSLCL